MSARIPAETENILTAFHIITIVHRQTIMRTRKANGCLNRLPSTNCHRPTRTSHPCPPPPPPPPTTPINPRHRTQSSASLPLANDQQRFPFLVTSTPINNSSPTAARTPKRNAIHTPMVRGVISSYSFRGSSTIRGGFGIPEHDLILLHDLAVRDGVMETNQSRKQRKKSRQAGR